MLYPWKKRNFCGGSERSMNSTGIRCSHVFFPCSDFGECGCTHVMSINFPPVWRRTGIPLTRMPNNVENLRGSSLRGTSNKVDDYNGFSEVTRLRSYKFFFGPFTPLPVTLIGAIMNGYELSGPCSRSLDTDSYGRSLAAERRVNSVDASIDASHHSL